MSLTVKVHNVGGISDAEVELSEGANFIIGKEGAGKTSLLNAIRFFTIEGEIPKGGRKKDTKEAFITINGKTVSLKDTVTVEPNPFAEFLMGDEMPSGDDLYFLMTELSPADVDPDGSLGLKLLWDLKKYMSNNKMASLQPDTFKMTEEEAELAMEIATYDLMNTYISDVASQLKASVDLSKFTGQYSSRKLLHQADAWSSWGECLENVKRAAKSKGKREVSEEIQAVIKNQAVALQAYLKVKLDVEERYANIQNGKWVGDNGLPFSYLSVGEKYVAVALLKKTLAMSHGGIVLFDNFNHISGAMANSIISQFHKIGQDLGVVVAFAISREMSEMKKKPPFPVYEMRNGVAELWK